MNHSNPPQVRESFERDGYVQIPAFLDSSIITQVDQQLQRFIRNTVPTMPSEQVFYEIKGEPSTLKQIQHLENHDTWFSALFQDGPFRRLAENLLGCDCIPINLQYFNKPPKSSKPTPPHQVGLYFMLTPCEAVTMWLALDRIDETNGCIRYLRGSHHKGPIPHAQTGTLGFSQGIDDYSRRCDLSNETPIHASPGDLLAHHALTVHRADANESAASPRRALGFIYYSAEAKQDIIAHHAYQERLKQKMTDAGRI